MDYSLTHTEKVVMMHLSLSKRVCVCSQMYVYLDCVWVGKDSLFHYSIRGWMEILCLWIISCPCQYFTWVGRVELLQHTHASISLGWVCGCGCGWFPKRHLCVCVCFGCSTAMSWRVLLLYSTGWSGLVVKNWVGSKKTGLVVKKTDW